MAPRDSWPPAYNNGSIISSIVASNSACPPGLRGINPIPYDKIIIYSGHQPHDDIVNGVDNAIVRAKPRSRRYIRHAWRLQSDKYKYAMSTTVTIQIGLRTCSAFVQWGPKYPTMSRTRIEFSIANSGLGPAELIELVSHVVPLEFARVGYIECKLDLVGIHVDAAINPIHIKNGRKMRRYQDTSTRYCGSPKSDWQLRAYDKGAHLGLQPGNYTRIESVIKLAKDVRPSVVEFAIGNWKHPDPFDRFMVAEELPFRELHPKTRDAFIRKGLHEGLRDYSKTHGSNKARDLKKDLVRPFTELSKAWKQLRLNWYSSSSMSVPIDDTLPATGTDTCFRMNFR